MFFGLSSSKRKRSGRIFPQTLNPLMLPSRTILSSNIAEVGREDPPFLVIEGTVFVLRHCLFQDVEVRRWPEHKTAQCRIGSIFYFLRQSSIFSACTAFRTLFLSKLIASFVASGRAACLPLAKTRQLLMRDCHALRAKIRGEDQHSVRRNSRIGKPCSAFQLQ